MGSPIFLQKIKPSGFNTGFQKIELFKRGKYYFMMFTETVGGGTAADDALSPFLWELTYSFKVNDSVTMIPTLFGGTDIQSATDQDIFGAALTTKFKF